MLHPPQLLLLGCFRFSFSTCWLSRCLAAAPLAQLFAAPAAGEDVAVLLASCLLLLSVVDAGACTVIVLCAVAGAELSAAAAAGETVESGRSPHGEGLRPVPLKRCWVFLRC